MYKGPGRSGFGPAPTASRPSPHSWHLPAWHGGCLCQMRAPPTAAWWASGRCRGGVMRASRKLTLAVVSLLLAWGVGVAPAQASDDTRITTKIRIALMTTDRAGRHAREGGAEYANV